MRKDIKDKYQNKILAVRNYTSDKKVFTVADFLDIKKLDYLLEEVRNGESDLTPAGKKFIEQYYGFEGLGDLLQQLDFSYILDEGVVSDINNITSWLEDLKPMISRGFIEKSRGNIQQGDQLQSRLLPPID